MVQGYNISTPKNIQLAPRELHAFTEHKAWISQVFFTELQGRKLPVFKCLLWDITRVPSLVVMGHKCLLRRRQEMGINRQMHYGQTK